MTTRLQRRGSLCLAGLTLLAVTGLVDVRAQAPQALTALTVPASQLPSGCALKPREGSRSVTLPDGRVRLVSAIGQTRSNPWMGTNNAVRTAARRAVEGPSHKALLPDPPALSREELAVWTAKELADIAEGYQADYVAEGTAAVRVVAVRYVDAKQATSPEPGLLVLGSRVVRVTGDPTTACYRAIWTHIESLR